MKVSLDAVVLSMQALSVFKNFENIVSFTYGDTENYKRKYILWLIFKEFAENFQELIIS